MNINALDTFVRQSIVRGAQQTEQTSSQTEIASRIGNARAQLATQVRSPQQTHPSRTDQTSTVSTPRINSNIPDCRYTFSIYV